MIAKTSTQIAFARPVAAASIKMPSDIERLSAGRQCMIEEPRGLCLFAGGNSMFIGEMLLTTSNSSEDSVPRRPIR